MTNETKAPKATKAVNYTTAQESAINTLMLTVTDYESQQIAIDSLQVATGKAKRSLVAKISTMSRSDAYTFTYHKKPALTKEGKAVSHKADMITLLAGLCESSDDALSSLDKGTKNALNIVINTIQRLTTVLNEIDAVDFEDAPDNVSKQAI